MYKEYSSNTLDKLIDSSTQIERYLVLELNRRKTWISTKEICDIYKITIAKCLRIVKKLISDVDTLADPRITLDIVKGKGINLHLDNKTDQQILLSHILLQSPVIQLTEAIFNQEINSIISYAQDHYLSDATVRRYLNKVRKYFGSFNVSISRATINLIGDEKQIRLLMMIFYWRVYGGVKWPFDNINEKEIIETTHEILNDLNFSKKKLPYIYIRQMSFYFAEQLIRTRKGNYISKNDSIINELAQGELFEQFTSIMLKYKEKVNVYSPELKFHHVLFMSMAASYNYLSYDALNRIYQEHEERNSEIISATNIALKEMTDILKTNTSPDEKLDEEEKKALFACHYFSYVFKGFDSDMNGIVYYNFFNKYHNNLTKIIYELTDDLYNKTQYSIFLESDFLLLPYINILTHNMRLALFEKKINIILETDMPILLTKHLENKIETFFQEEYNINFIDIVTSQYTQKIDVVITTKNIAGMEQYYNEAYIVRINRVISYADLQYLDFILGKVSSENK